jgi:SRSO17 transposase
LRASADQTDEKRVLAATNPPATTDLRTLAATIKARWICEQAHQQLKEELGLDHFEGRSWRGLHRHALMTMIASTISWRKPASPASRPGRRIPGRKPAMWKVQSRRPVTTSGPSETTHSGDGFRAYDAIDLTRT